MKLFPRTVVLTLLLVLVLSLGMVSASAQSATVFKQNFAKMDGEYPADFIPFNPGSVQTVTKGAFTISGGGEYGITDHGAVFAVDEAATHLTCAFKLKADPAMMAAVAFAGGSGAVQVRFAGGTILASFGGPYDFLPVGSYGSDWVHIKFDVDLATNTYDLYVDDVMAAEGLAVSPQPLPVNLLIGAMGTQGTVSIDNILVKTKNK